MMTMTYNQRQSISTMLLVSMLFSLWVAVAPVTPVHASLFSSVGGAAKSIFVNVGAIAAGAFGGVLGMAVGGGPLGMAVGAVGGYIVGKKVLNWTTSSVANFATVAGAVAGGALCIGMGFPMLAVGVIGGGLIARLAVKGIQKLFGNKNVTIKQSDIDPDAAKAESAATADFIAKLNSGSSTPSTATVTKAEPKPAAAAPAATIKDSQTAYNNYLAAYQKYMAATQKGDATAAKEAYTDYKTNLDLYNALIKSGK